MRAWIELRFHDYWHIGAPTPTRFAPDGRTASTPSGLPQVPGPALHAAIAAALGHAEALGWGAEASAGERWRVADAHLGRGAGAAAWRQLASSVGDGDPLTTRLFEVLRGDAVGAPADTVQVAVPMVLWAPVEATPGALAWLERAAPLIRWLGAGTDAGLGRTELRLHDGTSP